jgi:hypothetical protein
MHKSTIYILPFVLISVIAADINAQVDPGTENLTHAWTFNDGTANDYVGGADGTIMGTAEIFEGSYVALEPECWMEMPADQIAINTYSEVTLEIWFRPFEGANTGYHMIAYFGTTTGTVGTDYLFITPARQDDVSRAAISCGNQSTPWSAETGANGPELDDGLLHHMVCTVNAAEITLYIDGILQTATPLDTNNSIDRISTDFAYLAKGGYNDDPEWIGEILEFNIFNRALTSDEVLFLFNKGATTVSVYDELTLYPKKYDLLQNYPNPFNPVTTISYDVPQNVYVTISIYDILGRLVTTLVNETQDAGRHSIRWNASDLGSGNYFCRMEARNEVGTFTSMKKLLLLK